MRPQLLAFLNLVSDFLRSSRSDKAERLQSDHDEGMLQRLPLLLCAVLIPVQCDGGLRHLMLLHRRALLQTGGCCRDRCA